MRSITKEVPEYRDQKHVLGVLDKKGNGEISPGLCELCLHNGACELQKLYGSIGPWVCIGEFEPFTDDAKLFETRTCSLLSGSST